MAKCKALTGSAVKGLVQVTTLLLIRLTGDREVSGFRPFTLTLPSQVVSTGYASKSTNLTRVPECQKIKKGGLDQHDAERFGRLIFATIRKKCGTERVNT